MNAGRSVERSRADCEGYERCCRLGNLEKGGKEKWRDEWVKNRARTRCIGTSVPITRKMGDRGGSGSGGGACRGGRSPRTPGEDVSGDDAGGDDQREEHQHADDARIEARSFVGGGIGHCLESGQGWFSVPAASPAMRFRTIHGPRGLNSMPRRFMAMPAICSIFSKSARVMPCASSVSHANDGIKRGGRGIVTCEPNPITDPVER